jgi:hypothetical protein
VQIAGLSLWLRAQRSWQRQNVKAKQRPQIQRSNIVCAEPMPGEEALLEEFIREHLSATPEDRLLGQLFREVVDAMKLAGEAGSLLKIEVEIAGAVADSKKKWLTVRREKQGRLDLGAEMNSEMIGITQVGFWEKAEDHIYRALRSYAEKVESGWGGYQRRLFASDASQGFAFVDVCRNRYDVVLMNPPFGACSAGSLEYVRRAYPIGYIDLYTAFVDRGCGWNCNGGRVGAITSRTGFFLSSFESWRRSTLLGATKVKECIDLGQGVLDGAMVETAAYTIGTSSVSDPMIFFELVDVAAKENELLGSLEIGGARVYVRDASHMLATPSATFAYSMSEELADDFRHLPSLEQIARIVRGSATSDDERFIRAIWEVSPADIRATSSRRWRWLSKGGEFGAFYAPLHLVLDWRESGGYLGEYMYHKRPRNGYLWGPKSWSREFIGKAGITWPLRSQKGVSFRVLPADCAFSHKSPVVMSGVPATDFGLLAVLNTARVQQQADCLTTFGSYEMGVIGSVPVDSSSLSNFAELGREGFFVTRDAFSVIETDPHFVPLSRSTAVDLDELLGSLQARIDSDDRRFQEILTTINSTYLSDRAASDERHTDAFASIRDELTAAALVSEYIGMAFGRWDACRATVEIPATKLPEPFAPLPVCPPGQLQNEHGLPISLEDMEGQSAERMLNYPIAIPWDGVVVDDSSHSLDLEGRVREVLQVIWMNRAESFERDACEKLGVRSLNDYLRKTTGFFADHLQRYSKSRRQAPIYWPLSTPSGSYTLWIYYHRLTDQTLYTCVNDFVEPKLKQVAEAVAGLRTKSGRSAADERELERLSTLEAELRDFRDELLRIAKFWKPNLNDGVQITAAPLWKLFQHKPWQKKLKETWEKLESGDYDWAHLAYSIWPERVGEKCRTDKSLAIAHGLEELYEEPKTAPKKKRGRRKQEEEDEEFAAMDLEE